VRGKTTGLFLLLFLAWTLQVAAAPMDSAASQITVAGEVRTYWTYIPAGIDRAKPAPLLFVLHGSSGSGEDMMTITQRGFERIADREKFIVVYPDALERRWNDQGGTVDDAGFLLAVVDKLSAESLVDKKQVYAAGISNGGMMAQRMACEFSDRVSGIATIVGSMPEQMPLTCKPSRSIPVLIIHGTEDPIVPWGGGAVGGFEDFGKVLSVRQTAEFWAKNNLCRAAAVVSPEPDRDPLDGTRARFEKFADCASKAEVLLVTLEGGGHTWPGGYQYLPERFIGKTSRDIDANQIIWGFFRRFSPRN
jgi:polyhydroxybutyrate depolymerase